MHSLSHPARSHPASAADRRAEFGACFAAELARLEKAPRALGGCEAERLLSALGAAGVREWELALAFLTVRPTARFVRHTALPLSTLRRNFEAVMRR